MNDVLRPVDAAARALAKSLLRTASRAALDPAGAVDRDQAVDHAVDPDHRGAGVFRALMSAPTTDTTTEGSDPR